MIAAEDGRPLNPSCRTGQLQTDLGRRLTGGIMRASRRGPNSRDLARLAGVSQATVSRVLTDHPGVSPETREKVLKVLYEHNFTPNRLARAMKTGKTNTIGVFMSRLTSPFHASLLEALNRHLAAAGLETVLWNIEHDGQEAAEQVIRRRLVDGLLFTSAAFDSQPVKQAVAAGIPSVLVHRGLDNLRCDQVIGDNWTGAWNLGNYFCAAGHTRIGFVTSRISHMIVRDREEGFRAALAEHGVSIPRKCLHRGSYQHDEVRDAARRMLRHPDPPTAIFALTDLLAFGVLDAARSCGVAVPQELWVAGFNNVEMASWEAFDLTTVEQPADDFAREAVQLLRRRIADPDAEPVTKTFPCSLAIRGSTGHTPFTPSNHP